MTHQIENLVVNGSPMEVFVFEPEGKGPFPALIQCMHIPVGHTGIENDEFTLRTAERYRNNGYVVVIPFVFHWWPKSRRYSLSEECPICTNDFRHLGRRSDHALWSIELS